MWAQLDSPATAERLRVAVGDWIVQAGEGSGSGRRERVLCRGYGVSYLLRIWVVG